MTFLKKWGLFIVLVSIYVVLWLKDSFEDNKGKQHVEITVFKVGNGFGYMISADDKILIKQENIPVIQKSMPFCSKKDALKAARLVRQKLLDFDSPAISLNELNELNIDFKCLDL